MSSRNDVVTPEPSTGLHVPAPSAAEGAGPSSAPAMSPLLIKTTTTDPATSTTTHTVAIGYSEATLIGPGGVDDTVGQGVNVDLGANTADNTVIYADALYLQPGATYSWPGKNITIVARCLGMSSSDPTAATLSVSGTDGLPASPTTPPTLTTPTKPSRSWSYGTNGANGTPGQAGASGHSGGNAGNLTIYATAIAPAGGLHLDDDVAPGPPTLQVTITANGGNGTAGLDGQGGQGGQDGGEPGPNPGEESDGTYPGGNGGHGGDAGPGGSGGNGGNGGKIIVDGALAPLPSGVTVSAIKGTKGLKGADGSVGAGSKCGGGYPTSGDDGKRGNPVPPDKEPKDGVDGQVGASTTTGGGRPRDHFNPDVVSMFLSRLQFTYMTRVTLVNPAQVNAKALTAFASELTFWNTEIPAGADTSGSAWARARSVADDLGLKVKSSLDSYGNPPDDVPVLNPDVSEVASQIQELIEVEGWYVDLQNAVTEYQTQQAGVKDKFRQITDKMTTDTEQMTTDLTTLGQLATTQIPAAESEVQKKTDTLQDDFQEALVDIASNWNPMSLLSSLGSTLMMYNPEIAGPAFVAGGVLSGVGAVNTGQVNMGAGEVSRELLINQTTQVEASVLGLQAAWTGVTDEGLLKPNGNLTLLLAKKDQFDTFLASQLPNETDLHVALDAFMDAVQAQNKLVTQYNNVVIDYLQCLADQANQAEAKAALGGDLESLDAPGLLQVARLASYAYTQQMQHVLYQLYTAARAYQCLSLRPSTALAQLSAAETLADLDAHAMGVALDALVTELEELHHDLSSIASQVTIELKASAADPKTKYFVTGVQLRRRTAFVLDPATVSTLAGPELAGKYDVRVLAARGYLKGAGTDGEQIQVNVACSGRAQVEAWETGQTLSWFSTPEVIRTNVFTVKNDTYVDVSTSDVTQAEMHWGGNNGVVSLQAPLTPLYSMWTLEVADDKLDLTSLTEVALQFDISYRAKVNRAQAHPANHAAP